MFVYLINCQMKKNIYNPKEKSEREREKNRKKECERVEGLVGGGADRQKDRQKRKSGFVDHNSPI